MTAPRRCPQCDLAPTAAEEGDLCPTHGLALLSEQALALRAEHDHLGRVLAGKYALVELLGAGGFGAVYRAVQQPVRRPVAIKLIPTAKGKDATRRSRFFREAKLVGQLRDPASVTLHDYGEEADGTLYMVFELVEGRGLDTFIGAGPTQPRRAVDLLGQVLRALAEAHRLGVIHRDLKPANIMVTRDGLGGEVVRVLDFGIAKSFGGEPKDDAAGELTAEDIVIGTPGYMAPEQIRNQPLDHRTDLYAVGALAYAMLAGKPPFGRGSSMEILLRHVQEPPPPFDPTLNIPAALEAAVRRALEKAPGDRFQSAEEMVRALLRAVPDAASPTTGRHALDEPATAAVAFQSTLDFRSVDLTASGQLAAEAVPLAAPRRRHGMVTVSLAAAIGGAGLLWYVTRPPEAPPPLVARDAAAAVAPVRDAGPPDAAPPEAAPPVPDAAAPDAAPRAPDATPDAAAPLPDGAPEPARPKTAEPRPQRPRTGHELQPQPKPPATPKEKLEVPEF